jgi:CPA1 family monovalent cation:H+ antiporter
MAHAPEVVVILGLLVIVAVVAAVVRYVRIPYTVALVLTGLALALLPDIPRVQLTPSIILTIFLPVLLFYGAYNLALADLRANLAPIALLALPGVVATAGLVGAALHLAAGLSWVDALLFGTIVAATDPVAVLSIFGEVSAPRRLAAIVTGESLFNDGTALVFFAAALEVATAHGVDAGRTAEHFVVAVLGGLILGVAVGIVGSTVLQRIDEALLETTITLILAYGGYLLASALGSSGPLETVAAGLFLGRRGTQVMSPTTRLQAGATWEFLDFLANSLLFLLMGLALRPIGEATLARLGWGVAWPLLVSIVAVSVARAVVVWVVASVLRRAGEPLPRTWGTVLTWAGLRGAVALAAALSLPTSLPGRDVLLTLTFGIVLFTILVQGLTIRPLLERLGVGGEEGTRRDFELAVGRLRTVEAAAREVSSLRRAQALDEHLARRLLARYVAQRKELQERLDTVYHSSEALARQQEEAALWHLWRVQREAARAAYVRGQLSRGALRELIAEIDAEMGHLDGGGGKVRDADAVR